MKVRIFGMIIVIMSSFYFVSCNKDVTVTPPEASAPNGFVVINSNPQGAEIYINGKTTGRVTPDSLSYLDQGSYDVKLKLPYYNDTTFSVYVLEKERTSVSIDYTKDPKVYGKIYCESEPKNAEIYINGEKTSFRTPTFTYSLLPGAYTVTLKAYGCREDSARVIVKSGRQANVSITLQDTLIWVNYNMSNSGLPSNNLSCCAVDGNGTLWIGTIDKGLVSFDGIQWKTYDPSNSNIPSYSITSLAVPNYDMYPFLRQTIYIGTGNGLAVYSGGVITQYRKETSPLPDNHVNSVSIDGGNYVWIGTDGGLALIPDNWSQWEIYNKSNSPLPENYITALSAMPGLEYHHEAWIGTAHSGVTYFNRVSNKWSSVSSSPGGAITTVSYSNYTGLWFGWAGTKYSPSGLMNIYNNVTVSFPLAAPESVVPRPTATWVASSEGLYVKTTTGAWDRLNQDNSGLPQNSIKGIAFDMHGNAWITTSYMGLVKYKVNH